MDVVVREATTMDAWGVRQCNFVCLPICYSVMEYLFFINSSCYQVYVAVAVGSNNQIVGYMVSQKVRNNLCELGSCHVMSIGVLEEYRRLGIANRLIGNVLNSFHLMPFYLISCHFISSQVTYLSSILHSYPLML